MDAYLQRLWLNLRAGSSGAYLFALGLASTATCARWALQSFLPSDAVPFVFCFPALLLAGLTGGWQAGAICLGASLLMAWWLFLPPTYSFYPALAQSGASLVAFVASGSIIIWAAERHRILLERLTKEEHQRKQIVDELNHRLKNKLATVYAIVGRELKTMPEVWGKIEGRLKSLSVADEFISRTGTEGVFIRDILMMELMPYRGGQLKIDMDDIRVPDKITTLLALMFHELATNAAKYGSLSADMGELHIMARKINRKIQIRWVERGGPPALRPRRRGFGTTLLESALQPYQGLTEMRFDPDGLSCLIEFVL